MKKIMGFDVGDKRIGVALSDALLITAQGVESYTRKSLEEDLAHLVALYRESGAEAVVCGFPKNMNGTVGPQAKKVEEFMQAFAEKTGARVVYWDERMTTMQAERILLEADVSRGKRRKVIDKLAAVVILQSYLDAGGK